MHACIYPHLYVQVPNDTKSYSIYETACIICIWNTNTPNSRGIAHEIVDLLQAREVNATAWLTNAQLDASFYQ